MNDFWSRFWHSMIKMSQKEMSNIDFSDLLISCIMAVIIVQLVGLVYSRLFRKKRNVKRELVVMLLLMTMILMYEVAVLGRSQLPVRYVRTKLWWFGKNMDDNTANLLNVLFFVPFGIEIGLLLSERPMVNRMVMTACYSFLMSLSIEIVQYISQRGYFELVDMETNTVGGILGAVGVTILLSNNRALQEENK